MKRTSPDTSDELLPDLSIVDLPEDVFCNHVAVYFDIMDIHSLRTTSKYNYKIAHKIGLSSKYHFFPFVFLDNRDKVIERYCTITRPIEEYLKVYQKLYPKLRDSCEHYHDYLYGDYNLCPGKKRDGRWENVTESCGGQYIDISKKLENGGMISIIYLYNPYGSEPDWAIQVVVPSICYDTIII